jgi:hypothetical protein
LIYPFRFNESGRGIATLDNICYEAGLRGPRSIRASVRLRRLQLPPFTNVVHRWKLTTDHHGQFRTGFPIELKFRSLGEPSNV